jgi:formylglycine-generating enzyme required for sulfatase activity
MRFLAVALLLGLTLATAEKACAQAGRSTGGVDDDMVLIPAGRLTMGTIGDSGAPSDIARMLAGMEKPQHAVDVPAFRLARRAVTRGDFARFVAATGHEAKGCEVFDGASWTNPETASWKSPGFPQTDRDPVVCVSPADARAYMDWLATLTGRAYRLPSEAEWEYAARAGTGGQRYWSKAADQCLHANGATRTYRDHFPKEPDFNRACADGFVFTAPVGSFRANPWGLYDMLGNVWQWTADCGNQTYRGAPADGSAWRSGACENQTYRGGGWYDGPWLLRYSMRNGNRATARSNGVGFRLASDA